MFCNMPERMPETTVWASRLFAALALPEVELNYVSLPHNTLNIMGKMDEN